MITDNITNVVVRSGQTIFLFLKHRLRQDSTTKSPINDNVT